MAITNRLLRMNEVKMKVGLSRSTIYAMMNEGRFPASLKLYIRSVAWRESDIDAWIEACSNASSSQGHFPSQRVGSTNAKYMRAYSEAA